MRHQRRVMPVIATLSLAVVATTTSQASLPYNPFCTRAEASADNCQGPGRYEINGFVPEFGPVAKPWLVQKSRPSDRQTESQTTRTVKIRYRKDFKSFLDEVYRVISEWTVGGDHARSLRDRDLSSWQRLHRRLQQQSKQDGEWATQPMLFVFLGTGSSKRTTPVSPVEPPAPVCGKGSWRSKTAQLICVASGNQVTVTLGNLDSQVLVGTWIYVEAWANEAPASPAKNRVFVPSYGSGPAGQLVFAAVNPPSSPPSVSAPQFIRWKFVVTITPDEAGTLSLPAGWTPNVGWNVSWR